MRDKLIIIGNYDKTRDLYDQSRTDGDVWAFNEMWGKREWLTRCDAIFQLHAEPIWRNPWNRTDPNHFLWLCTQHEVPVYMQEAFEEVPMAVKYPLEEIIAEYLTPYINKTPFGSTPAYALALGLYQGYKEIECFGIELGTESEYGIQRPEFAFWAGVAAGRKVHLTLNTHKFLNSPMYGYQGEWSIPLDAFRSRLLELTPPVTETRAMYEDTHKKVYQRIDVFQHDPSPENYTYLAEGVNELNRQAVEFGMLDGARQENKRYLDKAQVMIDAAGGYIFSRQELESAKMSLMEEHKKAAFHAQDRATKAQLLLQSIVGETDADVMTAKIQAFIINLEEYVKANTKTAIMFGALQENHAYLERIDKGIAALGGQKALDAVLLNQHEVHGYDPQP